MDLLGKKAYIFRFPVPSTETDVEGTQPKVRVNNERAGRIVASSMQMSQEITSSEGAVMIKNSRLLCIMQLIKTKEVVAIMASTVDWEYLSSHHR